MDKKQDDEEIAHLEAIAEYYRRKLKQIQELIQRIHVSGSDKKPDSK